MDDFQKIARRPHDYLNQTGIPQLTFGSIWSCLGLGVLISHFMPHDFLARETPKWVAICIGLLAFWAINRLKQREIFPRGGYVEPRPMGGSRRNYWIIIAVFMVLGPISVYLWRGQIDILNSRLIWPGFAIAAALICIFPGRQQESPPMIALGIFMILVAPALWWLPLNNYERSAVFQFALGAPVAIFGAFRLHRYLKTVPAAHE